MTELHRSARGKMVDMNKLATQNELELAVSNVKINARGDELGPGGQIIRKTPDTEIFATNGVPSEHHIPREKPSAVVPAAKPAAKPAIVEEPKPKPTFTPVSETQNALIQPARPNNKGK